MLVIMRSSRVIPSEKEGLSSSCFFAVLSYSSKPYCALNDRIHILPHTDLNTFASSFTMFNGAFLRLKTMMKRLND